MSLSWSGQGILRVESRIHAETRPQPISIIFRTISIALASTWGNPRRAAASALNLRRYRSGSSSCKSGGHKVAGKPGRAPEQPYERLPRAARRNTGVVFLLMLAIIGAYWPIWGCEFINYDDPTYVSENPVISRGVTLRGIVWSFTTFEGANWHPVTWLSHMLDVQCFGMRPEWHHLVSVAFHMANTLLLFCVMRRMTISVWSSAMVSALFALHPLHVESVAWIAERKDVLSAFFGLLAIMAYVRYVRCPSLRRYLGVAALLLCGLMAKPMLVTLPFVLLLLDYWPLNRMQATNDESTVRRKAIRRSLTRLVLEKLPLLTIAAASGVITWIAQRDLGAMAALKEGTPFAVRAGNALVSYVTYVGQMVFPLNLAVYYPYVYDRPLWQPIAAGLLLIGASAVAVLRARLEPYLLVGWFWYLGMLVPVIGLVQVGTQAHANRYTYLPLVGIFLSVVCLVGRWARLRPQRHWIVFSLSSIVLIACFALTVREVMFYRDTEVLFTRATAVTGQNAFAELNLADYLGQRHRFQEAEKHLLEVIRLGSKRQQADAHELWSWFLSTQQRRAEAEQHYREAIRIRPDSATAHNNLAMLLAPQGKADEAINLLREAVRLAPERPETVENLAWALVSYPDASPRSPAEVVQLAEKACQLDNEPDVRRLDVLARAYAAAGRWSEAASAAHRAAAVARQAKQIQAAEELDDRARQYESRLRFP